MPHLLVAISPHGYGHTAQIAPVLNALYRAVPGLRLTLRTTVNPEFLASRIHVPFELQAVADDFGMVQHDALHIDHQRSLEAYRGMHADWPQRVERVARELEAVAPDWVLADVPYLTLAAAERAGISSIAMCCLNWADIFAYYCLSLPGAAAIHAQMLQAYNSARYFLRTAPAMAMAGLDNIVDVGPVAEPGINRRSEIAERANLAEGERLVLVAMGGIATRLPMEQWPVIDGVRWLVQADWLVMREDVLTPESLGLNFRDALASCDVLLTKPGYGSFTEAVMNGVPVLYVSREDWPEEPYLVEWMAQYGVSRRITAQMAWAGGFGKPLRELLELGRFEPGVESGVAETVAILRRCLNQA